MDTLRVNMMHILTGSFHLITVIRIKAPNNMCSVFNKAKKEAAG